MNASDFVLLIFSKRAAVDGLRYTSNTCTPLTLAEKPHVQYAGFFFLMPENNKFVTEDCTDVCGVSHGVPSSIVRRTEEILQEGGAS